MRMRSDFARLRVTNAHDQPTGEARTHANQGEDRIARTLALIKAYVPIAFTSLGILLDNHLKKFLDGLLDDIPFVIPK